MGTKVYAMSVMLIAISNIGAEAQTIVSTGFEKPAFIANTLLDGQDGWLGVQSSSAIWVVDLGRASGKQCVKMIGSALEHRSGHVYEAVCGTWLLYDGVADGRPIVRMRVRARLDGPDTGEGPEDDLVSANFYAATSSFQNLGSFYVSSNGTVYGNGRSGGEYAFSVPYQLGTFVDLELLLNFAAGTTTFIVDGQPIGVAPISDEPLVSTEISAAPLELWVGRPRLSRAEQALYTAYFDDYSVSSYAQ